MGITRKLLFLVIFIFALIIPSTTFATSGHNQSNSNNSYTHNDNDKGNYDNNSNYYNDSKNSDHGGSWDWLVNFFCEDKTGSKDDDYNSCKYDGNHYDDSYNKGDNSYWEWFKDFCNGGTHNEIILIKIRTRMTAGIGQKISSAVMAAIIVATMVGASAISAMIMVVCHRLMFEKNGFSTNKKVIKST